jgi:hypothetical protein
MNGYQLRPKISAKLIAFLFTALLIVIQGILILSKPIAPIYDQTFIQFSFAKGYPTFEQGISSLLIVGFLNWVCHVDQVTLNSIVRVAAATGYTFSAGLLSWRLFTRNKTRWLYVPFLLLLPFSGFPFLWLSSELFAGTFIMLTFWSLFDEQPFLLTSIFLAFYTFAKPDLILSGAALGLFAVLSQKSRFKQKFIRIAVMLGTMLLILLPSILINGFGRPGDSDRSLISFSQHYASLVSQHQIGAGPDPWLNYGDYIKASFGDVHNMLDVVSNSPAKYIDFVFLSISQSVQNMVRTGLIVTLLFSIIGFWKWKGEEYRTVLLFFTVSLVPIVLLSYLHVRYQARFYPLLLITAFIAITQATKWRKLIMVAVLIAVVEFQLFFISSILLHGYWFPD